LCPPAVSPSIMKPSTRPLDLRASVMASVAEETMARKTGRWRAGSGVPGLRQGSAQNSAGLKNGGELLALGLIDIEAISGRLALAKASRTPG